MGAQPICLIKSGVPVVSNQRYEFSTGRPNNVTVLEFI